MVFQRAAQSKCLAGNIIPKNSDAMTCVRIDLLRGDAIQ